MKNQHQIPDELTPEEANQLVNLKNEATGEILTLTRGELREMIISLQADHDNTNAVLN